MSQTKIAVLFGAAVLALAGSNLYLFRQVSQQRTTLSADISALRESMQSEMANLNQGVAVTNRQTQESINQELAATRKQAAAGASKAKAEATQHAEQLTEMLAAAQQKQQQEVADELTEVKEAAGAANSRVAEVSGHVTEVKTSVADTRSRLESAVAELKSVRGDLGVQSGLIATNAQELAALRAMGERNFFEFNLAKTKVSQPVGEIRLSLRKLDPTRSKYTIDVYADDKRVEKKDKNLNEPVQFYVGNQRQPYEIVVNEIRKDRIVGYLATPKVVAMARR